MKYLRARKTNTTGGTLPYKTASYGNVPCFYTCVYITHERIGETSFRTLRVKELSPMPMGSLLHDKLNQQTAVICGPCAAFGQ